MLLRLASLKRLAGNIIDEVFPLESYLAKISRHGSDIEKLILKLIDSKSNDLYPDNQSFKLIYYTFSSRLKKNNDPSPAFLLELVSFVPRRIESKTILKYLQDIIQRYPLETISPVLMKRTLKICHTSYEFRNTLPELWNQQLAKDLTPKYYFPQKVLQDKEKQILWLRRVNYSLEGPLMYQHSPTIPRDNTNLPLFFLNHQIELQGRALPLRVFLEEIYALGESTNIFKLVDKHYRFDCTPNLNVEGLKVFIEAGIYSMTMGALEFIDRIPHDLRDILFISLSPGKVHVTVNQNWIPKLCLDNFLSTPNGLEQVISTIIGVFRSLSIPPFFMT